MEEVKKEAALPINSERLKELTGILQKYKAGKSATESRIISSENWWKLRSEAASKTPSSEFESVSGWLHNVIVSKHADAIEAYPEPNILPREEGDRAEALMLSKIIPCILEQNGFEQVYNDAAWQKDKTGTGCFKIFWDSSKLGGLGDIGIERVNLLNVYWEPGITDIQRSRYFFHTELLDKDILEERYPQVKGKLKTNTFLSAKFLYDDAVDTSDKATVIDCYYHKVVNGKNTLQFVQYIDDIVLYATENQTEIRTREEIDPETGSAVLIPIEEAPICERGLYDHGKYPYEFDALFPIEGSPCGYGYVDICKNPQTAIDMLNTSFIKSAKVGAVPRYLKRTDGSVNEAEFLDLSKPIVHIPGGVSENDIKQISFTPLSSVYVGLLDRTVNELRETSGNTEASTGATPSGVTAASAIAALQEASGKGSRDANLASYRSYRRIVSLVIELIRQFYDMPRRFRIMGDRGTEEYVSYSNEGLKPQHQGDDFGRDMGYRLPVFDIKVSAQKANIYTKVAQNELAIQLYQMGMFNPQNADQALAVIDIMDFDGKDQIIGKISKNQTLFARLVQYMQLCIQLAMPAHPMLAQNTALEFQQLTGQAVPINKGNFDEGSLSTERKDEHHGVTKAREKALNASQPKEEGVIRND